MSDELRCPNGHTGPFQVRQSYRAIDDFDDAKVDVERKLVVRSLSADDTETVNIDDEWVECYCGARPEFPDDEWEITDEYDYNLELTAGQS